MIEQVNYHSVEALERLSLQEFYGLWDLMRTERLRVYKQADEHEVRNVNAA